LYYSFAQKNLKDNLNQLLVITGSTNPFYHKIKLQKRMNQRNPSKKRQAMAIYYFFCNLNSKAETKKEEGRSGLKRIPLIFISLQRIYKSHPKKSSNQKKEIGFEKHQFVFPHPYLLKALTQFILDTEKENWILGFHVIKGKKIKPSNQKKSSDGID